MTAAKGNTIQATGTFVGIRVTLPATEIGVGGLENAGRSRRCTRTSSVVAGRGTITFGITGLYHHTDKARVTIFRIGATFTKLLFARL